jgi:DNA topoisomerase-1
MRRRPELTPRNVLLHDSRAAAKKAHLRYVGSDEAGLERRGRPGRFRYFDARGRPVKDVATLSRIASLAIPPAWTRVWICPFPQGHLQATGYDVRGRKQYRYHPAWRSLRDRAKYSDIVPFARALTRLRPAVARDLRAPVLSKKRLVATIVTLLERTQIRVGNEKYAHDNDSYGLTTLRTRHATVGRDGVKLSFRGKSGKRWQATVRSRELAEVVRRSRQLPGRKLFKYLDEKGKCHAVTSADVNAYLHEHMGPAFSAKEFRTWAGTLSTCKLLFGSEMCKNSRHGARVVSEALDCVAAELGNTRAVCRKAYVDPLLFDCYLQRELHRRFEGYLARARRRRPRGLSVDEQAVISLLESLGRGAL